MEPEEPLPTDSVERRRIQNRNAQRKFRYKRSLDKAVQASQQDSAPKTTTTSMNALGSDLWHVQNHSHLMTEGFVSSDGQLQTPFSSTDFHEAFPASSTTIDDFRYPTPEAEVCILPGFNTSAVLPSPSIFRNTSQESPVEAVGAISPINASPLNDLTQVNLSTSPLDHYHITHNRQTWLPSGHSTHLFTPSGLQTGNLQQTGVSNSELDAYVRHTLVINRDSSNSALPFDDWLHTLHIAAQKGHDRIVRILLERDVDIHEKDSAGKSALHFAAMEGHEAVVRSLLAHGARVDEADFEGRTSLHWAVLRRHESVLRILLDQTRLDHGSGIDIADNHGWTALHAAVEKGFEAGLQLLLQHGANHKIKAKRCTNSI